MMQLPLPLLAALCALLAFSAGIRAEALGQARANHLNDLAQARANTQNGEEVVILGEGDTAFLGLRLQQRTPTPQGAVLILHDQGHNPDWPVLLQQTRNYLPDVGWNTLSIALPLVGGFATDAETTLDRIALGVQRLNQEGQFNLVVLGYGEGAYWAARYLSERLEADQDIGYGLMMVNAKTIEPDLPDLIGNLNIPILDWVSDDSPAGLRSADNRRAAARRNQLERFTRSATPGKPRFTTRPPPIAPPGDSGAGYALGWQAVRAKFGRLRMNRIV